MSLFGIGNYYRNILCSIEKNAFIKNTLTLSLGTILGQGINILGMPIVLRLYRPDVIGMSALLTGNGDVIGAIACMGLMTSIMLPKEHGESKNLCQLTSALIVTISIVIVLLLYLFSDIYRIAKPSDISYGTFLFLLWLYICTSMISNVMYAYINRFGLYKIMFWNTIIGATVTVGLSLLLGIWHAGFLEYSFSMIISYIIQIIFICKYKNPFENFWTDFSNYSKLLIQYKRFPIYQMPANMLSSFGMQILIQNIALLYSESILGLYTMAVKLLRLPSSVLANSINRVYYREAVRRYNEGEAIGTLIQNVFEKNIKFALIPIFLIIIFGEWIFGFFLGNQWTQAGAFAGIIAVFELLEFGNRCLSGSFVIINRNKWNLYSSLYIVLVGILLYLLKVNYSIIDIDVYLYIMCVLLMLRTVVAQAVLIFKTGGDLREYFYFVLKYIILPFVASVVITMWKKDNLWL